MMMRNLHWGNFSAGCPIILVLESARKIKNDDDDDDEQMKAIIYCDAADFGLWTLDFGLIL